MNFSATTQFRHGSIPATGVLLCNLGTPEAPTPQALRVYLKQFLSDPRLIEVPRWKWLPILHLFILNTRPKQSAEKYARIWTEQGSPLLTISRQQCARVQAQLQETFGNPLHVALGMRIGRPSIAMALRQLRDAGCQRVIVLPLFPQYSGTTTASVFDAVSEELRTWRWVPELRFIGQYHDHPLYISALAQSIRKKWECDGQPQKLVMSFHGLPKRYFLSGDPYFCHCQKTARLLAEHLHLQPEQWVVSFQSLFGREEWIRPYTDETLKKLASDGVESVDVICPGFSADCLETLEEIDMENREIFLHAGGSRYGYIPALNDDEAHIAALVQVVVDHAGGWLVPRTCWNQPQAEVQAQVSCARAEQLQEQRR